MQKSRKSEPERIYLKYSQPKICKNERLIKVRQKTGMKFRKMDFILVYVYNGRGCRSIIYC